MDETAALRRRLDPLYAGPPEEFVAARDALAKELRAAGDAEAARAVGKLRRPSVAAALVNRVALGYPEETKAFARAVARLRQAKGRQALKDAARAQREATATLVELAAGEGGEGAALDRVAETLQAAAAAEEVENLLLRGRLEKERRAASIGFGLDVGGREADEPAPRRKAAAEGSKARGRKEPTAAERKRAEAAEQRREQERREVEEAKQALKAAAAEQVEAEEGVEDAEEALAAAKGDLVAAKEAAKAAASAVKDAKRELRERERELADLD